MTLDPGGADALGTYLRSIARIPALDSERLRELLHELHRLREARDPEAYQQVKNRVVTHHLRLVVGCAVRWRHPSVPLIDQIQEGNLGLLRAVERFEPGRQVCFSTYAVWWIRRNIWRAIESQGRTVHLPRRVSALQTRARRTEGKLRTSRAEAPGSEELAAALCVSPEAIDRLRWVSRGCVSLDRGSGATGLTLAETLKDPRAPLPDAALITSWARRVLERGLTSVDERARRVLRLRCGLDGAPPMTLAEVGACLELTGERVRQIEKTALRRLRSCRELERLLGALE